MKYCILFMALLIVACSATQKEKPLRPTNQYAKGFSVIDNGTHRDVFVNLTSDLASKPIHYRLIDQGQSLPDTDPNIPVISVPISTLVCTSTTHIPHLDYLGETEKLVGFPSLEYISSPAMRKQIDAGNVDELGKENGLNLEKLAQRNPALVMAYTMTKDLGQLKKIEEMGIPVVLNADFLEQHPLGRAEWIKFTALFFKKERLADSIFQKIESEYLTIKSLTQTMEDKPTVLTGIPYGGVWYLPGGQNYAAAFFKDAGCQYLWADDASTGFLQLSLETIYEKAVHADYWIGVASFQTFDELKSADSRFANFAAFKNKTIYHYNGRIGATGGNEYFELAYLRPDLLLKDLIQITHPKVYPNPELYFYKPLQ